MNFQYRADFWPGKITQKVRKLREMIKNTKSENKAELLCCTRDDLTTALAQHYDLKYPQSVVRWAQEIRWQVRRSGLDLEFVLLTADRKLPVTANVHAYARNLAHELENIIGKIESQPVEKG